ncbi:unannotated protein [freshwater metagenome]|uniref:Unannotated protein n=1 Tax=freshwater metagenome TaxID=449393 RepID=A0A6J6NDH3_9ZZZZ
MNLLHEDLARAQIGARLGLAQQRRQAQLARAHRVSRRAQHDAEAARTAIARAF